MDLRPKLANAFLQSLSLTFTDDSRVSTEDQPTAELFLRKYPRLRKLIDLAKAEATRRWPQTTFHYRTWTTTPTPKAATPAAKHSPSPSSSPSHRTTSEPTCPTRTSPRATGHPHLR